MKLCSLSILSTKKRGTWSTRVLLLLRKKLDIKPVAFIAAISEDGGLEQYLLHPKSISQDEFIHFMHQLSEKYEGEPISIFMDNLQVHKS